MTEYDRSVPSSPSIFRPTIWKSDVRRPKSFDWLLVTDYWLLITGYWLLITDYWLLTTGYLLLITGY